MVDLRIIRLILAIGSFIYGMLLILFKFNKKSPQEVPFWIMAKILQGIGSLLLFYSTDILDAVTMLGSIILLLGCSYEAWAIRIISEQNVKRMFHIGTSLAIIIICSITILLDRSYGTGLLYLTHSIFYLLPSLFLYRKTGMKFSLHLFLAVFYFITGFIFLLVAILYLVFPKYSLSLSNSGVFSIIPLMSFCIFLISGYILLMLAKERSDMQIMEIQKNLQKSQIRFQQIVETAIEGILIFDQNYRITFANENMASMLGYTIDEMRGRSYISFFPECQLDVYNHQEYLRKKGIDSIYECCLLKKDGQKNWFLVSATPILDDHGNFDGSFAMLTDINERKEMELLLQESNRHLTELSNKDSLTGIANRRCFDTTLEHEYSRLKRSNSKLSIILIDIDHFKEYNEYYGHVKGDECLRKIGQTLESCVNQGVDLAARYGGEEFACILPDTDIDAAVKIAEKIQQSIRDLQIEHKDSSVSEFVTASFGVTTVQYSPDIYLKDIIGMADKLLYKAKVSGRNIIKHAEFTLDR